MIARRLRLPAHIVRNVDAGDLSERFLVSAIASFLGIRFYLELTGYPQVGGRGLHIAHMLWGGLLMLIALILLLSFLGRRVRTIAAVAGGLGFGTFIDELGKFITSDNNYFFRPAVALIYIIFVALYLAIRSIDRRRTLTQEESLVNALDLIQEAVLKDMDTAEKQRAVQLLDQADPRDPLVVTLRATLTGIEPVTTDRPWIVTRLAHWCRDAYFRFVATRWFLKVMVGWFVLGIIGDGSELIQTITADPRFKLGAPSIGFTDWILVLASVGSAAMAVIGLAWLRRSHATAFVWLRRSVLASIFVIQPFHFYSQQLVALVGLSLDILTLVALEFMIEQERRAGLDQPPAATGASQIAASSA